MEIGANISTMISQALLNTQQQTDRLAQLQAEASTGYQVTVPSDNPAAMTAIMAAQGQNAQLGSYLTNIQSSTATLNAGVTAMSQAANLISQAQSIATEASSSTANPQSLETMANQVDQLLNQLLATANTKSGNQYLFAGADTQQQPFSITSANSQGNPQTIAYQGAAESAHTIVGTQQSVATMDPGSLVFQSTQRAATVFQGSTGAQPGSGTDSATGQGTLTVSHTATTYATGSGVTAGTSSASGDTVLGPPSANTISIVDTSGNGSAGTISLNGGPAVNWTNSDTNLQVAGPGGQIAYVNTTAINAGFQGTVNMTTSGTLSMDGGKTTIPINYSANQVVTNSTTGAVTNVDSKAIDSTGVDQVQYPGTYDAFQVLMSLRDDLNNTTGMSAHDQTAAISNSIGELERVSNSLLTNVGRQSTTLQYLQGQQSSLQQAQLAAQTLTSNLQDVDVPTVVVQLQAEQNQLQLTLAATGSVMQQTNLVNFLQ